MTFVLASAIAWAQTTAPETSVLLPGFSAQNFRPTIDSRTSWWTERSGTHSEWTATAQLFGQYMQNALVRRFVDGSNQALLSDVFEADLTGGLHYSRFRLGLAVPLYLAAEGDAVSGAGMGLGDLAVDLKINALRDGSAPFGFSFSGRLQLPTTTIQAPLGGDTLGWEVLVLADKEVGRMVLAANAGARSAPFVELDNIKLDDQLLYRGAVSFLLGAGLDPLSRAASGLSVEVAGQANFQDPTPAGVPIEVMAGGWMPIRAPGAAPGAPGFVLRGGIGTGLTQGIGAADVRALFGVAYDRAFQSDRDLDGVPDRADTCPTEPEDVDQRADEDGCPDPETKLTILVETPDGKPVPGVTTTFAAPDGPRTGDADLELVVPPGKYGFTAAAPGYAPIEGEITVPLAPELRLVRVMTPTAVPVTVKVTDLGGNPVNGEWSLDGSIWTPTGGAPVQTELLAGAYTVHARAPGFVAAQQKASVAVQSDNVVTVQLGKRVGLGAQKIELNEVVKFATGSDAILPASFALLDEVALILNGHPELTKVKIEGHTDSQGSDSGNLDLSTRRAAAIVTYLMGKGVSERRLESEGFGETVPIASNDTEEGRAQNRRVEIKIVERAP